MPIFLVCDQSFPHNQFGTVQRLNVKSECFLYFHPKIIKTFLLFPRKHYWSGSHKLNNRWLRKPSAHAHGLRRADDDILGSECVRDAVSEKDQPGNR